MFAQSSSDERARVDAIMRSQAVIEFNLDGSIISANENFLAALGYRLEEIVGKHHRMFVDPVEAQSPAYSQFWADLAAGEFQAAVYRRIAKGGRDVWIQASYNPVLDKRGKPVKIIKFATDITAQKNQAADHEAQMAAISRAQAMIEFDLDGIVQRANENFLATLGYRMDEIAGKHHRMFCDPAYTGGADYARFWERLRAGEYIAAEFQRFGKGGKEVWIQASYNPILDARGKPVKVIKFATDITERKRAEGIIGELTASLAKMAEGDLTGRIDTQFTGHYERRAAGLQPVAEPVVRYRQRAAENVTITEDGDQRNPFGRQRSVRAHDQTGSNHRGDVGLGRAVVDRGAGKRDPSGNGQPEGKGRVGQRD
ncbi:PAS domain S-box protein [Devosia ginsengisoli]|uniref:PAS domain S-box protein n=1 Tax=Devosia ginsengisoli TaxID=400770 RepID=A0A5B8M0S6_9HYPH|nr:PAS domain S-box protein [Devosia ginsengisoli]